MAPQSSLGTLTRLLILSGSVLACHGAQAQPDPLQNYVCGREAHSAAGCYTHWCMGYELSPQPTTPSKQDPSWMVCYVKPQRDGGVLVYQGGVAWWGWERGQLGDATLGDFWVRDYRTDRERDACGVNCTRYGLATQIKARPSCYRVKENWTTASASDMPANSSKPKDGWLHKAYCMHPITGR